MAEIFDRGALFYKNIRLSIGGGFSTSKSIKLDAVITAIEQKKDLDDNHLKFENDLIRKISVDHSSLLEYENPSELLKNTVNFIVKKYNSAVAAEKDIQASFEAVKELALRKNASYYSVYGEIGKSLANGKLPTIGQVIQASHYVQMLNP